MGRATKDGQRGVQLGQKPGRGALGVPPLEKEESTMGVKVRERPKDSAVWWVFVDHNGQRKAKKCGSKKLADKVAKIMEANLTLGRPLLEEKEQLTLPTLAQYYERFKATYMETAIAGNTASSYEGNFRVHILPELGKYRLDEIDRSKMEDFVAVLMKKKRAKGSIRLTLSTLGVLYNNAIKKDLVLRNPARGLAELYRQAPVVNDEIEPLTEENSLLFLRASLTHEPKHYSLFLTALHTGMRSGEINGLQWPDVDWRGKFIEVRRQIVRGEIKDLKTKHSRRRIDCSDELLKTLSKLQRQRQEEALKRGSNEIPKWVFVDRHGSFANIKSIKLRPFKKVLKKAGLRYIRFHDLRHTFASLLLSRGENLLYVSQQLGHSSPQITLKVYAHWIPTEGQREAVNRLPSLGVAVGRF